MLQQRFDVVLCSVTGNGALAGGDVMVVMITRPLFAGETFFPYQLFFAGGWCREYQVLPDRTHPTMMMDSSNGNEAQRGMQLVVYCF